MGAQQAYYKTLQQGGTFQDAQQAAQASYAQQLQNSLKMFDDMAELGGMDKQQRNFMKADMLENMGNTQGIMSPMLRGMIDNLRKTPEMDPETQKLMAVLETQKAQEKYSEFKDYRASEGKVAKVSYKGPVRNIIHEIFGGLRSACTYTNSQKLQDLSQNTTFFKVSETTNNIYGN